MTTSRLRLNANKNKVLWLHGWARGTIDRLTIRELNVLDSVLSKWSTPCVTWVSSLSWVTLRQFVRRLITNCGKFNPWCGLCRLMPQRRWSRHSSPVGWITATQYSTASPRTFFSGCSQCRTRRPGWSRRLNGVSTCLSCDNFTGWQWLPGRRRVEFKLAVLVYKVIHGLAPP